MTYHIKKYEVCVCKILISPPEENKVCGKITFLYFFLKYWGDYTTFVHSHTHSHTQYK